MTERGGSGAWWSRLWLVYRYDLRVHLRDPITLMLVLGVPVLLYPLMGVLAWYLMSRDTEAREQQAVEVALVGEAEVLAAHLPETVTVIAAVDPEAALAAHELDAYVELEEGQYAVRFDTARATSRSARSRLEAAVDARRDAYAAELFAEAGSPVLPKDILVISEIDLRSESQIDRAHLGRVLPLVLILLAAMGGLYAALDLITGEKERGTLETLLVSRIDRQTVMVAKIGAVTTLAAAGPLLSACSGLLVWRGFWPESLLFADLPATHLLLTAALLTPLVLFVAAACSVAAALVPDFKSGQVYALPALLLPELLAAPALLPDFELGTALLLVPITNVALAMRSVLSGQFEPTTIAAAAVIGLGQSAVLVVWAGRSLGRESVLLGSRGNQHRRLLGNYVPDALGVFAAAFLLLWFVGQLAQGANPKWGIVATQWLLFGPLALAGAWWIGLERRTLLQLVPASGRDLLFAVVIGLGAPGLGQLVLAAQQLVIPQPTSALELWSRTMLEGQSSVSLVLSLALGPAVCEELLFRGTILGLLRRTLRPWPAILLTAVLFGALHLSYFRMLPTATLGLVMGVAAYRSGSIFPAMIIHFLNNSLAVLGWVPEEPVYHGGLTLLVLLGLFGLRGKTTGA